MQLCQQITAVLALPLLPALASAAPDLDITWEAGVLDRTLAVDLEGTPGRAYVLIPSFQTGPLPLGLFDPGNPTSMDVGLDLQNAVRIGFLNGSGESREIWPLPDAPALVGLDLRAQAVELLGDGSLGDISNDVELRLSRLGDIVPTQGAPARARAQHEQVQLDDGSVLLIGGRGLPEQPALVIERYDPQSQSFVGTRAALPSTMVRPKAALLANGDVLICGGVSSDGNPLTATFVYDPDQESLKPAGSLATPRVFHTLTALPDGTAIAIGGAKGYTGAHPLGLPGVCTVGALDSVELFDPNSNTWSAGQLLPGERAGHTTDLIDGKLVVAGGLRDAPGGCEATTTVWIGDGTSSWANAATLGKARAFHAAVPTVDDALLVVGGADAVGGGLGLNGVPGSESVDPSTGSVVAGPGGMPIIIDGREQCIPAPRTPSPSGPLGVPVFPGAIEAQPDVVYYASGGFSSVGATAQSCVTNTLPYRSVQALQAWTPMTNGTDVGLGQVVTPVDGGLRLLTVGLQATRLATVE